MTCPDNPLCLSQLIGSAAAFCILTAMLSFEINVCCDQHCKHDKPDLRRVATPTDNSTVNSTVPTRSVPSSPRSQSGKHRFMPSIKPIVDIKWKSQRFVSSIFTIITVVCYVGMSLQTLFQKLSETYPNQSGMWNPIGCKAYSRITVFMFALSKALIYNVLIMRLQTAYKGSVFEYSNRLLYTMRALVIIYVLGAIPVSIFGGWGEVRSGICQMDPYTFIVWYIGVWDALFIVSTLYLFNRPLLQLMKSIQQTSPNPASSVSMANRVNSISVISVETTQTKRHPSISPISVKVNTGGDEVANEMRDVGVRYAVLSTTAVLSTLFMIMVASLKNIGPLLYFDWIVNVACLLFMNTRYAVFYNHICCLPDRCYKHCCK